VQAFLGYAGTAFGHCTKPSSAATLFGISRLGGSLTFGGASVVSRTCSDVTLEGPSGTDGLRYRVLYISTMPLALPVSDAGGFSN